MMIHSSAMATLWKPVSVSVVAISIVPVVVISVISFSTDFPLVLALLMSLSTTLFIVIQWTLDGHDYLDFHDFHDIHLCHDCQEQDYRLLWNIIIGSIDFAR